MPKPSKHVRAIPRITTTPAAMGSTRSLAKANRLVRASIPQSWYDFKPLHSQLSLIAPEKPLVAWLVLTYTLATVTFFGQVAYYSGLTSTEFVVSDNYNLPGHVCRPLQHDQEYDLSMTYDECMAQYVEVKTDDLMSPFHSHGWQKPAEYDSATGDRKEVLNGPWNMSFDKGLDSGFFESPPTYYHIPFKGSHQPYTFNPKCSLTLFPDYFTHSAAKPNLNSPFDLPCDFASSLKSGTAYGAYSICNKSPGTLGFTYDDEYGDYYNQDAPYFQDHTFFPAGGTDFVTKCGGSITAAQQTDLFAFGGYAFPRCHSVISDVLYNDEKAETNVSSMAFAPGSIGITPMYPKATTLDAIRNKQFAEKTWTWDANTNDYIEQGDTFFGYPRCEFYERQMAKEAYEYIYSQKDCHPCDGFKYNTPFHCDTETKKTAAEIIALSVSNSMALLGVLLALAPLLLRKLTCFADDTKTDEEQPAKEQPAKEQPAKEQPAKERPPKERPAKERPIDVAPAAADNAV